MFNQFGGLKIVVSDRALRDTTERVKTYPKRKARTPAHWRRMDKKWRKRYGFKKEACAWRLGDTVVMHPVLYAQLQGAVGKTEGLPK